MKKNNILFGIGAVVVVLIIVIFGVFGNKTPKESKKTTTSNQSDIIPTVDSSVKVDLVSKNSKKAVDLTISGIPEGTTSIDYSISYLTKQQGLQGIIGAFQVKSGEKERTISRELGTCSSGKCVYHEVVGTVKVALKFSGQYGERAFDKEYPL